MSEFKKGDWVIRQWEDGLDIDIARVKYINIDNLIYADKYYRLYITSGYEDFSGETAATPLKDRRMKFDWRLMTSEEKKKYFKILDEPLESVDSEKSVFTDRDLQDAINEGIFDRQNNVTANPAQIIRFFEKKMQEYGELCAKYGAKSIRYQVIDIVHEFGEYENSIETMDGDIVEEWRIQTPKTQSGFISKIQNLEP